MRAKKIFADPVEEGCADGSVAGRPTAAGSPVPREAPEEDNLVTVAFVADHRMEAVGADMVAAVSLSQDTAADDTVAATLKIQAKPRSLGVL